MSLSAANAAKFWPEVVKAGVVWGVRDEGGFPTFNNTMPFWSSEKRATRIIATVPAYADFAPVAIPLAKFLEFWLPGLARDGVKVGVNWYGKRATGYDFEPDEIAACIAAARAA